ncbi:UDP-N-acetylmuramoyl-L-alanine--D-glutamate ligase [Desulfolucanica intricata]|uniref:UDP-N-acetylmuramoyl-L-alanine--D-glutamate ligase n=1 Tax=Desulfolucanica intricata TaxID=1285191 RepID=UPI000836E881|nr:UDP-N-acetylmuramoyl-L-alanine--D-glutamate ligase [Desulfolucanica intricata]
MKLEGKKVLIVGAGKSGLAAARFLSSKKAQAVMTDVNRSVNLARAITELGVIPVLGQYPPVEKNSFDLVVVSPGVPLTVPPVAKAYKVNIPVIGELELAYRFAAAPMVAITGTNGKTTTTTLVGEIFKDSGQKTLVAGNIGFPLVTEVEKYGAQDIIVAEVSSFQLETIEKFRPKVAVILNITPDHLDRHGNMENYITAKANIFKNQGRADYTVLNFDDPLTKRLAKLVPGKVIFFSRKHILDRGVFVRNKQIVVRQEGSEQVICPVGDIKIPGGHNLENALAATAAVTVLGVKPQNLAHTLKTFPGVEHRLEFVAEIGGVRYINDSKGTNPDASIKALEAYQEPIVLIAGGRNKGSDFTEFLQKAKNKVRTIVILGECAEELQKTARAVGFNEIIRAKDFTEAVTMAGKAAHPGDIVLLSPACASWDMFKNYEERGRLFKEIVQGLRG